MKRSFRLTRTSDFKRVRRLGKSYAHALIVLVALPAETGNTQIGVAGGRSVGGAVQRNRAKRILREAMRPYMDCVLPGWQIVLLARRPLAEASLQDAQTALHQLLAQAGLLKETDGI